MTPLFTTAPLSAMTAAPPAPFNPASAPVIVATPAPEVALFIPAAAATPPPGVTLFIPVAPPARSTPPTSAAPLAPPPVVQPARFNPLAREQPIPGLEGTTTEVPLSTLRREPTPSEASSQASDELRRERVKIERIMVELENTRALAEQRSVRDQAEQTRIHLELQHTFAAAEERRATEHAEQMAQIPPRRETRFDPRGNLPRYPQQHTNHGEELAAHYRLTQQDRPGPQWTPGASETR
jgi:hypothetical protein